MYKGLKILVGLIIIALLCIGGYKFFVSNSSSKASKYETYNENVNKASNSSTSENLTKTTITNEAKEDAELDGNLDGQVKSIAGNNIEINVIEKINYGGNRSGKKLTREVMTIEASNDTSITLMNYSTITKSSTDSQASIGDIKVKDHIIIWGEKKDNVMKATKIKIFRVER